MAHAFFDDSGKFADTDFVCIAGYIAHDSAWEELCQKWGMLLLRHNIPFIHMKDLIPLRGPYENLGWDIAKRDEVLREFIDVIREHVVGGFGVGVDSKYLRSMCKDAKQQIGDPAMLCFQRILRIVVNKLQSVGYQSSISPVFDDCEEYSVRCYRMWSRLRKNAPELSAAVPSITFANDHHFWPLQAADVLAWETNKHLRQMAGNFNMRKQMETLMQSTTPGYGLDYTSELWDAETLEELYRDIKSGKVKIIDRI